MESKILRKPVWLRKKISINTIAKMRKNLSEMRLHTICEEAMCPNISECFSKKEASFLILGNICTRLCSFCNVQKNQKPLEVDENESKNVALTVKSLNLKSVVITSPTRDDLDDFGALQFAKTVKQLREITPETKIELLIPDLMGDIDKLKIVTDSNPDIISHNLETVKRLYEIRKGASYERSLFILKSIKDLNPKIKTKSGIMLGLGEKEEEIIELFEDLLRNNCKLISIGQYIAPSRKHITVKEYLHPDYFNYLKDICYKMGFEYVESSPYTRSSYNVSNFM